LRGVEDTAVSCFVGKLKRDGLISSDLVTQVDIGEAHENIEGFSTVGEEVYFGRALISEDLLREIDIGVK